jgi:hypothetical protein
VIRLNNFKLDKDIDSNEIYLNLKKDIDEYTSQKEHKKYIEELSKILNIPYQTTNLKFKKLVYGDFELNTVNFNNKYNFLKILSQFLFFLIFLCFVKIFGKNNFVQKKFDIIIDEVDGMRQFNKFSKIITKFKNPIIFTKNKNVQREINNKGIVAIRYNRIAPSKILLKKNFFIIIKFFFQIFLKNFQIKENYFIYYLKILLSAIKNKTLFSKVVSEIALQDRFYINCPIKNFFFKKHGGKKIISCQNHLAESGICFYADIDILFSFGNEKKSEKKLRIFGSRIGSSFPVGSLQMEREYYIENENLNESNEIDLLIIGIKPPHLKMSNKIYEGYYKYLKWIKNLSEEKPDIKILYKHHASFAGDIKEKEIFNSSKVKILSKGNTYPYFKKSKVIVSFGSTMILEALSLKKKCFFTDPDNCLSTYYSYHDYDKNFFLSSYKDFSKKILSSINSPETKKDNFDRMCLESDDVSNKIYHNLINS